MQRVGRPGDEVLEVARVLLLVQGAILIATTIEAAIWGMAFAGAAGPTFFMSGTSALGILVARARLRAERRRPRRFVYVVEGWLLGTMALDAVLAIALTGAIPPFVALLTRLMLPIAVIVLLRRSARQTAGRIDPVLSGSVAL